MEFEIVLNKTTQGKDGSKSKKEKKKYTTVDPSLKIVRKAIEITEDGTLDKINLENIDKIAQFTVDLFENQFTVEEFYEGLPTGNDNRLIMLKPINDVLHTLGLKLNGFPDPKAEEPKE